MLVPPLLVPPLLVPPSRLLVLPLLCFQAMVPLLVRLHALVPMVQRQPHRICYFLDCPRKFRLCPLWWLKKSPDFTHAGHRIVKPTLLFSFFCSTGGTQARMFIKQYSLQYVLIITEYIKKSE